MSDPHVPLGYHPDRGRGRGLLFEERLPVPRLQIFGHKNTVVGSFERCIFCRGDGNGKPLTDEHAFPAALGGRLVLEKATCDVCRGVTSQFESRCINTMFQGLRMNYGFTSARNKNKKQKLPLTVRSAGKADKVVRLGRQAHPSVVGFPVYARPTFITKEPEREKFSYVDRVLLLAANAPANLSTVGSAHNATALRIDIKVPEVDFGRLLAKAAHCFGVATLGADGFSPLLIDAILFGDQRHLSRYVGGSNRPHRPPNFGVYMEHLNLCPRRDPITDEEYLMLEIEAFAGVHLAPIYNVCFGRYNKLTAERLREQSRLPNEAI